MAGGRCRRCTPGGVVQASDHDRTEARARIGWKGPVESDGRWGSGSRVTMEETRRQKGMMGKRVVVEKEPVWRPGVLSCTGAACCACGSERTPVPARARSPKKHSAARNPHSTVELSRPSRRATEVSSDAHCGGRAGGVVRAAGDREAAVPPAVNPCRCRARPPRRPASSPRSLRRQSPLASSLQGRFLCSPRPRTVSTLHAING